MYDDCMCKAVIPIALAVALAAGSAWAQQEKKRVFYLPRPAQPAPWQAPMKPHVRLADLKAKHFGEPNWSEVVIADRNSLVEVIQAMPGSEVYQALESGATDFNVASNSSG